MITCLGLALAATAFYAWVRYAYLATWDAQHAAAPPAAPPEPDPHYTAADYRWYDADCYATIWP